MILFNSIVNRLLITVYWGIVSSLLVSDFLSPYIISFWFIDRKRRSDMRKVSAYFFFSSCQNDVVRSIFFISKSPGERYYHVLLPHFYEANYQLNYGRLLSPFLCIILIQIFFLLEVYFTFDKPLSASLPISATKLCQHLNGFLED